MFNILEVGKPMAGALGREEGVVFDVSDAGAQINVFFDNPTAEEVLQFHSDEPLEVRFAILGGEIFMLFKFGDLPWMDAPYNPHLSRELTDDGIVFPETKGLALQVILADTRTGNVKAIRLVGLMTEFSNNLFSEIRNRNKRPFSSGAYFAAVNSVFDKYQTEDMVGIAKSACRVN